MEDRKEHVAVRLDVETVIRVDELAPGMSSNHYKCKRSDVMRAAILLGLPLLEKEYGVKRPVSMADPMKKGAGK